MFTEPACTQPRLSSFLVSYLTSRLLFLSIINLLATGCVAPGLTTKTNISMTDPAPISTTDPASISMSDPVSSGSNPMRNREFSRDMADWVVTSRDNLNKPFAIVDKVNAKVYVFGENGEPYGTAPVLLGLAKGDDSVPGIGNKPLSLISPSERTTPAGRYDTVMGRNTKGKEILWLDYEQALSMHAVVKGVPRDRRAQRLASPTPLDNRISFGCINVPKLFFKDIIKDKFSEKGGIVYILPENVKVGHFPKT